MSGSVQPPGSQNSQNTAVENQSVGRLGDWEVIHKEHTCCKNLLEKVSGGFSFGRSLGRAWCAVKEGVSAFFNGIGTFFKKRFGEQSGAVSTVRAQVGTGNISVGKTSISVGVRQSVVSHVLSPFDKIPVKPSDTLGSDFSKVSKKTASKTSSTQSTASVKKDAVLSSPKYRLVDVPGDGHCGVWAVLAGMGAIKLSECIRPQHGDYGGCPIATSKQKKIMINLRQRAAGEALKAVHTNLSAAGSAARLGLRDKSPTLETVDFQYIAQAIGRPIVISQYQGKVEAYRTICDPKETEPTSLFREDFNNQQLRQGNPIRLYFDGGHYQLMQPIKTS